MNRYPDLTLTVACLATLLVVVGWATMPARRRPVLVLPRIPVGAQRWN